MIVPKPMWITPERTRSYRQLTNPDGKSLRGRWMCGLVPIDASHQYMMPLPGNVGYCMSRVRSITSRSRSPKAPPALILVILEFSTSSCVQSQGAMWLVVPAMTPQPSSLNGWNIHGRPVTWPGR